MAGFTVFVLEFYSAMFNRKPDYFLKALKADLKTSNFQRSIFSKERFWCPTLQGFHDESVYDFDDFDDMSGRGGGDTVEKLKIKPIGYKTQKLPTFEPIVPITPRKGRSPSRYV